MDAMQLGQLLAQVGLPIALTIYFVRAGQADKEAVIKRLDVVTDRQLHMQETVIKENTDFMRRCEESHEGQTRLLAKLTDRVERLNCANPNWDGTERRRREGA